MEGMGKNYSEIDKYLIHVTKLFPRLIEHNILTK
jgi:hypothetical protein